MTAPTPYKHYDNRQGQYDEIRSQLKRVNHKFRAADAVTRRKMLRSSHRFAVLSIQAPVHRHEAAFKQLEGLEFEEEDPVRSLNYWKNKMSWIKELEGRADVLDRVAEDALDGELDDAHRTLIDEVTGVGAAKAAFMLAMLGFTSKMCVDTNVQQAAGIEDPYTGVVVHRYESMCRRVLSEFDGLCAAGLDPFMVQWVLFDFNKAGVTLHEPFFNAVLQK